MSDITLYDEAAEQYDVLQNKRPDYVSAIKTFVQIGSKYLIGKEDKIIIDFCCGIGKNSFLLSEKVGKLKKVVLIDINEQFLKIAKRLNINAQEVSLVTSDVLKVKLLPEADAVISLFAYHHVPDNKKEIYIEKVKSALKTDAVLFLGEIYLPSKDITNEYYEYLINSISKAEMDVQLKNFLKQTAESSNFEFKVSQSFAHSQLRNNNFTLLESKKIWPIDGRFPDDVGMFFEVWKLNQRI